MPDRIQLSRAKGWRMPPNAVKVDRTTRWGNPHRAMLVDGQLDNASAVRLFRAGAMLRMRADPQWLAPLRGKDLACWCRPGAACHADVLIELANRQDGQQ